ncbi:2-keto-3-deoxy-galactonokinase [Variibacter gotjawalensis]|uniref:2-keto-3-deoxy-galactonokinase n=1 Tax=Variibacter gotjawalensis TaxID=1333996 RepID=A0A0S3PSR8_9BRAD|nr:2-dehydro-3-deoxygalactonokinase [Variibacter gotjawalensis]NIK49245.1 2-dehydro-3-deoxygalactonokinase [Variibacter gotjawalensis]RZS51097.1 2-keto-3-deoxygalactonate kinase [Variibacter gotjawalensis]BAT58932.1 2-keto-3-deoxy-galactonokinase [Variibacter gotjawalensis]
MDVAWIAVDWGTSNVRAWGIAPNGDAAFGVSSDQGMSRLARADYPAVLGELLTSEIDIDGDLLDVVICGMAGARQGWCEAPYLETPARLDDLLQYAVTPDMPPSRLRPRILPGVCQRGGNDDVMRGEETQLLGLIALDPKFEGIVCMPGTHAKWVELRDRQIKRFATAITGELFEVLSVHSVLRHSLGGEIKEDERQAGTLEGLQRGIEAPEKLTSTLFRTRAGALLSGHSPSWCAGYLSGLLIGADIGGQRDWIGNAEIPLIGGATLSRTYQAGLEMIGARSRVVDATEATLTGLRASYVA